jgi:hypothetical protein
VRRSNFLGWTKGKASALIRGGNHAGKIWVSCSHNRCGGSAFVLISGTQESEDQEYMHKPFEPEPSSGSFAATNVKLSDPLRFWPVLFPAIVFDDKNSSRA